MKQIRAEEVEFNYKLRWRGPNRLEDYTKTPEEVEIRQFFELHIRRRLDGNERKQLLDADGDGPYATAQVLSKYLEALSDDVV